MASRNATMEKATRNFKAFTMRLGFPRLRYMKNRPEKRLTTTSTKSSTNTYFITTPKICHCCELIARYVV